MNIKLLMGFLLTLTLVFVLGSYIFLQNSKNPQTQNGASSQNSVQAPEPPLTYQGVLPCADCSGIDTTIVIRPDKTFTLTEIYQGKNDDKPFVLQGTWELETGSVQNPQAQVYVLKTETGETYNYLVDGSDKLTSLGPDKNPIDAPFNLSLTLVSS